MRKKKAVHKRYRYIIHKANKPIMIPKRIIREVAQLASKLSEPPKSPLLDRHQAASILNVSAMTVRRIEADGKLQAVRLRPGAKAKVLYRKDDVLALAGIRPPKNA